MMQSTDFHNRYHEWLFAFRHWCRIFKTMDFTYGVIGWIMDWHGAGGYARLPIRLNTAPRP